MHRRGFFAGLTALLITPLIAGTKRRAAEQRLEPTNAELRAELLRYLGTLQTRHTLGNTWLAQQQPPPAIDNLLDTLTAQLVATRPARAAGTDIHSQIAAQVRMDFSTGNTVNLHGWILSATEAQLCGAACLLARGA